MTKEIKDVVLTEREQGVIKWECTKMLMEILRLTFGKMEEKHFEAYVSCDFDSAKLLNAMYFVCILLDQGNNENLAELVTKICNPEDGSMKLFMKTSNISFMTCL